MKISVLVPVYNEEKTIAQILKKVKAVDLEKEIIVVDDGSTDSTRQILLSLKDPEIRIFYHDKNKGKGAALSTAVKEATGDIILFQDADLEYDPREYKALTEPIINGMADVVYGSRLIGGKPQRVYMFWHKVGNSLLSLLTNILFNTTLSDMETGYKVFRREIFEKIKIKSKRFSVEPEITAKVCKKKFRIYEMPISYYGRTYAEGKKITWRQGISAIFTLLWYRFFD